MPALENVEPHGSDPQQVHKSTTSALFELTLSPEDAANIPSLLPPRKNSDPMIKTKRRMFAAPLLRRSATASGAAAASAASKIKSMTKLPNKLKRSSNADSSKEDKATANRAPTVPTLPKSNSDVTEKQGRKFGMPSLKMKIRATSRDGKPPAEPVLNALDSPDPQTASDRTTEDSEADKVDETPIQEQKTNTSRFVSRMPAMLKRVVSTGHNAAAPKKASPDTSAKSTPRGDSPEDPEENTRRSLLMMMQVPEALRRSQLPLMAAGETW